MRNESGTLRFDDSSELSRRVLPPSLSSSSSSSSQCRKQVGLRAHVYDFLTVAYVGSLRHNPLADRPSHEIEGSPVVSDYSSAYLHGIILRFSKQGKKTWCSLMTASQKHFNMTCRKANALWWREMPCKTGRAHASTTRMSRRRGGCLTHCA